MKKFFQEPELEVQIFISEDVMVDSGVLGDDEWGGGEWEE